MVTVEIWGKQFPLCLTVAALDKINEKCGDLKGLTAFLDGKGTDGKASASAAMCNTAWVLGLLIQEGEENRIVCARFTGGEKDRREVPDITAIGHLLTYASAAKYRTAVMEAINESLSQEIEALYPKNVQNAERR